MRPLANIMPGIASDTGKRAIAHHLTRASAAAGAEVIESFGEADRFRQSRSLGWAELIGVDIEPEDRHPA